MLFVCFCYQCFFLCDWFWFHHLCYSEFIRGEATTFSKVSKKYNTQQKCAHCKLWCLLVAILGGILLAIVIAGESSDLPQHSYSILI